MKVEFYEPRGAWFDCLEVRHYTFRNDDTMNWMQTCRRNRLQYAGFQRSLVTGPTSVPPVFNPLQQRTWFWV